VIHETISTTRVHIAQLVGILDELARKRDALESYTEIHISLLTPRPEPPRRDPVGDISPYQGRDNS
jgi:hypothetical protein